MFPSAFEYSAPTSLEEALGLLKDVGDDGRVLAVDHFGNVITNIDRGRFEAFKGDARAEEMVIGLAGITIQGVVRSYDHVKRGFPVAIFGSRGLLEVSVNQGDAFCQFKIRIGQSVCVSRPGDLKGR